MDALPSTTLARFQIGQNSTMRKRSPILVAGLLTAAACVCPTPSLCGTQVSAHGEPTWRQDTGGRHDYVPIGVVTKARHGAYADETAEERQHNGRGQHQARTGRPLAHSGSSSVVLLAKRQDTASAFRFPAASLAGAMALVFLTLARNALFERTRDDDFERPLLQTPATALPSAIFPEKLSVAFILLVLVAAAVAAPIQAKTQQPAAGSRSKRNTGISGDFLSSCNSSKEQQSTVPAATPGPTTGRGEVVSQLSTSPTLSPHSGQREQRSATGSATSEPTTEEGHGSTTLATAPEPTGDHKQSVTGSSTTASATAEGQGLTTMEHRESVTGAQQAATGGRHGPTAGRESESTRGEERQSKAAGGERQSAAKEGHHLADTSITSLPATKGRNGDGKLAAGAKGTKVGQGPGKTSTNRGRKGRKGQEKGRRSGKVVATQARPQRQQFITTPAPPPATTTAERRQATASVTTFAQSSTEGIAEATIPATRKQPAPQTKQQVSGWFNWLGWGGGGRQQSIAVETTPAPTTGGQQQEVEERSWLSRFFLTSGSEKKATEEEQVSFLTSLYNLAKKQPQAIPKAGPPPVTCSMENGRLVTHIGKGWCEDSGKSMEGTLTINVTYRGRKHVLHLSQYTEACIKRNPKHHLLESLTKALQVPQTEVEKVGERNVRRWWDPKANNWFVDGYTYDGIDHQLYLPMELWTVLRHKYREWKDVELLWRALVREIWKVPADAPTTTVEPSETPPTTIVSQAGTIWTSPQHSEEDKATFIPQAYSSTTLSEQPGESWITSLHSGGTLTTLQPDIAAISPQPGTTRTPQTDPSVTVSSHSAESSTASQSRGSLPALPQSGPTAAVPPQSGRSSTTFSHPGGGLTTSSESDSTAGFPSQSQNSSTASPSPEGSLTTSAHSDFTVTSPQSGAVPRRSGGGMVTPPQ